MVDQEKFMQLKDYFTFLVPGLTEAGWAACEKVLTVRTLKKGAYLLREGSVCNHVSFINYGLIRMFFTQGEKEKNVCFFNENTYVSEYHSFLTQQPSFINIQALETSELVEINFANLQRLYDTMPESNKIGRLICEQIFIVTNEANIAAMKETLEERYLKLVNEYPWIIQKVPQYMIASYLGVTPEALSRAKAKMNRSKAGYKNVVLG